MSNELDEAIDELKRARMSYLSKLYAEHGLKPGARVTRVSAIVNGTPWTMLYLYDTGADQWRDYPEFKREAVVWDGVELVSCDNGD